MTTTGTKPIICGTDFSESASQAAIVADALARHLDAPLILVRSADERGDFPDHIRERLMNDDRPRLTHEAERLRSLGLTLQEKLLHGAPNYGVADFAARENARLVVVGASGTGALWGSRGVVTEVRIVESGDAGKTICEAAERFCADLVCIGSHGHSGLAAALMGSVAQAVVTHSRCPVLLIRP